jgi:hypothetical protein
MHVSWHEWLAWSLVAALGISHYVRSWLDGIGK